MTQTELTLAIKYALPNLTVEEMEQSLNLYIRKAFTELTSPPLNKSKNLVYKQHLKTLKEAMRQLDKVGSVAVSQ